MIKRIHIELKIESLQRDIFGLSPTVDPDDAPFLGWVPTFRAIISDLSSDDVKRYVLNGPNSFSKDDFEKTLNVALSQIRIQSMRRFDDMDKRDDKVKEHPYIPEKSDPLK